MKGFLIYTIVLSIFLIHFTYQKSQIFQERSTCEISIKLKNKNKSYLVPAEIDAENDELRLIISLCTENNFVSGGQSNFSEVFLYNKTTKLWVNNTANLKPYEVAKVKKDIEITLQNEIKCNDNENYQISIILGTYNKVRLNIVQDCMVEIELTLPEYDPECMKHLSGKWFIDLSPLRGNVISLNNDKDNFKIALCGKVPKCEAGCKISGNETTLIGSVEKQKVKFSSNEVSVVSSIKPKKSMEVLLKCNWTVKSFEKPKLLHKGPNYKFEVQSSYGCVKTPVSCIQKKDFLTFNLAGLTTKNGTIVTNSTILFHICGDLDLKGPKNNSCHLQNSQVCEIKGRNYLNRGSIPNFEVIKDDHIKVTFNGGQECNENEAYSTVLDLKCSLTDSPPTLVSEEGCVTKIYWETQKACPKYQINETSCSIHSSQGNVDLAELYRNDDYTQQFHPSQNLIFNICGRLHSMCSNSADVTACFIDGNIQKIIGWNWPNLSFIDGKLQLKYTGEKCVSQNKPYSLIINMICSFVESPSFLASSPNVSKVDDCTFTATVVSSSACLKQWEIKNCTVDEENFRYDLSPLMKKNENYEIKDDSNSNITYFLNLCAPVIPRENLLFSSGSMVYMENSSIALITKRFTSLGAIAGPTIEKDTNKLVVATFGTSPSSKIIFECSDEDGSPTILGNKEDHFEFTWKTKHACPKMKENVSCMLTEAPQTTRNEKKNDQKERDISVSIVQTQVPVANVSYVLVKSNEIVEHILHDEPTTKKSSKVKEMEIDINSDPSEHSRKYEKNITSSGKSLSSPNSRCSKVNVHENLLDLNDLKYKEFKVDDAMYIFNFNGSSPKCSGFICKNGDNILSFIEKCPDVSYEENSIILTYFTEEICHVVEKANSTILPEQIAKRIMEISLSCNYNEEITTEVTEANCKIVIHHSSPKICIFFSTHKVFVLVVIIVIFLFIFLCFIVYLLKKNNYLKKCSYQKVDDDLILIDHHKIL
ncbi:cation-independent mannose-6-phosphate receptor isoform X2 [Harmonia axyridis]|uniref:cation-independent mannose-6-phosphate receptor isoform X2 n=1 Tax=Harmonia axyridis TaxID=115357 RepID=UPI001E2787DE|nr:cation-independent mannose-6-phosphate receptor isoform X2 [Harmonia axyridis]